MAKPFLITSPKIQFLDNVGVPLAGGKVFIYNAGTTTKQNTYTDATLATPNPNPVILDSAGRPSNSSVPIDMYIGNSYKMVVAPSTDTDPPSNALWTEDNITSLAQTMSTTTKTTNYQVVVADRDKLLKVDASGGPITITLIASSSAGDGFRIKIKKIDSSTNTVTIAPNASENIDLANSALVLTQPYGFVTLDNDGTQWFSESFKSFNANPELVGSTTAVVADGVTLSNVLQVTVTAGQAALASAGKVNIQVGAGVQQFRVLGITLSGAGTSFSGGGGDRLIAITDGTHIYTKIAATLAQTLTFTAWGATNMPGPVTASDFTAATTAGSNLYLQYSGGTVDYTAGSLTVVLILQKVA